MLHFKVTTGYCCSTINRSVTLNSLFCKNEKCKDTENISLIKVLYISVRVEILRSSEKRETNRLYFKSRLLGKDHFKSSYKLFFYYIEFLNINIIVQTDHIKISACYTINNILNILIRNIH